VETDGCVDQGYQDADEEDGECERFLDEADETVGGEVPDEEYLKKE
jgi:hypothetical protein